MVALSLALAAATHPSASRASAQQRMLAAGGVRVFYAPRQAGLAREVLAAARRPLRLPGLGVRAADDSVTIVLAPDAAAFAAATGGGAPEWAGGVAIPAERLVVLPTYPAAGVRYDERGVVLRHELAHLALHRRVGELVPRWFDEGYAEVASGGWDVESAWQLRLAFATGSTPPLDSLTLDWPRREADARLAYLLSATAVDYLHRRGGERGMALLFARWRELGELEPALRATYGITLGQLEHEWRADVRTRYGWLALLSNLAVIWLAATALVLLAWIPRRRRNRRKLAQMDAEEHLLPPAANEGTSQEYPLPDLPTDERP